MRTVIAIPAFRDNYIWAILDGRSEHAVVVDPGDAAPVKQTLAARGLALAGILITHHHHDHTGGIDELLADGPVPVWGPAAEPVPQVSVPLSGGEKVEIEPLSLTLEVIAVPGHTSGHIAYFGEGMLFCGDTLFAGGCGRLFEGTAAQMHASLSALAALPPQTRVYCAHEYTESNLRFALQVEPDNAALVQRLAEVSRLRAEGDITLPSSIELELATNPFLRPHSPSVIKSAEAHAGRRLGSAVEVFTTLRAWKDGA